MDKTGSFSKRIADLSPEKKELLLQKLSKKKEGLSPGRILPQKRTGETTFPLSFAQQRLWFLDQLTPESYAYNLPAAIQLEGLLDQAALKQSLNDLVKRHETLRTTFRTQNGQPVQSIAPELSLALPLVDLTHLPASDRQPMVLDYAEKEARLPFDLEKGPLLRASLLRLGPKEHILLLAMHHIISDGWSMGVLVREMIALYQTYSNGTTSPLPELPIQYVDFVKWQQDWLQGENLQKQLAYWKQQLANVPALELPTDRPKLQKPSNQGAKRTIKIPKDLTVVLEALSKREGATLFMTLLAAFQALLYRYTGQVDITIGTPIANRNRSETESLIGFFVNMLVIRTNLGGDPQFRHLLGQVRDVTLGAFANQDLPFEHLVKEMQPERDLSRTPFFQVVFAFQNAPVPPLQLDGLLLTPLEYDREAAKFDLEFHLWEDAQGISGQFIYSKDLFEAETIDRMADHFHRLLENIAAEPDQRISRLRLMSEAERQKLIVQWNATQSAFPVSQCIHEIFAKQAERTPEAIALVFDEQRLTYAELDARSNRLAHHLRRTDLGPNALVGICVDRSVDMIVGVLGILKAGGAYLPLDPTYPKERLQFMLEDTAVRVLLTQERLLAALPEHQAHVICLDSGWDAIAREQSDKPSSASKPESLAYVIYTSGSTGTPKGVEVSHRNVVRLFAATQAWYHFNERDVWTLFHSYAFDFSVWEIWGALLHGGKLVVVPFETSRSPEQFHQLLCREGVTVLNQTPSAFRSLVTVDATMSGQIGLSLRLVIFGGESIDLPSLRPWFSRHGDRHPQLVNMYGITETTVHTTYRPLFAADLEGASNSPIGRPIPDLQVYVLDEHMQLVPVGVAGELHIGGAGVARGYLNRPELTAARFVRDTFSTDSEARLYKTGDLCRWRADGNLEFLGRIDQQVKIRGFRIELGEIEAALSAHPSVQSNVVIAREDVPGDKRLVAYVVPNTGECSPNVLRQHVRERLPDYMIPSAFVVLESLPLTSNGKINRKALPAPEFDRTAASAGYLAPNTPTEATVANIWSEVLGVERVGVQDNFFELGGHSLLATRVISRMREIFKVEIPLIALFNAPTVAELSAKISAAQRQESGWEASSIERVSREQKLPLSFAQQRLWFLDQLQPGTAFYNMPFAVRLLGRLNREAFERALNELVRRHETLRTTFRSVDDNAVQVISENAVVDLTVIDLSDKPEEERESEAKRLVIEEAQKPFNLSKGPLMRTSLLVLAEQQHVLMITMHHIISDGWSMGIFVQEMAALYEAFSAGRPSPLQELPIQYVDFAIRQSEWLQGEALEKQVAYWKKQLGGELPVLQLPTDHPRPVKQTFEGASQHSSIGKNLKAALKNLSVQEGATLFMTLLAAFKTLLHRFNGQEDIIIGFPIANRNRVEIEGLIGFFLNNLALRTDLSGNPSFRQLLRRVRETSLQAFAHQDLPFEKLLEVLQPERDMSRTPIFQVMFNMLNMSGQQRDIRMQFSDLMLEEIRRIENRSRFDLTLYVSETDEEIQCNLVYNTNLFEASTIAFMLDSFQTLLESIAADPDRSLSQFSLLSEGQRMAMSSRKNHVAPSNPFVEFTKEATGQSIARRFEEQVARHSKAVAIKTKSVAWTYEELNKAANRIAHAIIESKGSGEGSIAILFEHDASMIAAMLGVLKSGKSYIPLDPLYPEQRLSYMIADSQATVLVTGSANISLAKKLASDNIELLDIDESSSRASGENPGIEVSPDNIAYLLYTSGSTGEPKGVKQSHRNVLHHIRNYTNNLHLGPQDKLTLLSSYSFDAAVMDIFGALLNGATLHPIDVRKDGLDHLTQWLVDEQITIYHSTPTLYRYFINNLEKGQQFSTVRFVVLGGEEVQKRDLDLFQQHFNDDCLFINGLGPTESTLALQNIIDKQTKINRHTVPVGYPVDGTDVLLLNRFGQPDDVLGEISIRSEYVALGYWKKDDLTAAAFLDDPEGGKRRIYRTGDMGRLLPDGSIEYLGRQDRQVKIRGYRIEVGEIETQLLEMEEVKDAAVIVLDDASSEKRLVSYIVGARGASLNVNEVRNRLRQTLPEHMIPSAFVFLDALPLTPSGKIDRRALPESKEEVREALAARTPIEEMLTGIWSEVLGIERVGVQDNFFELGGHSLLATRVISRMREIFKVEIPLIALFNAPTVAELSAKISAAQRQESGWETSSIERVSREQRLPLSFAQQRLWFLDRLLPASAEYNIPIAMRLRGPLDVAALQQAVAWLVNRHEVLRTNIGDDDVGPVQCISTGVDVHVSIENVSDETTLRNRLVQEARRPFDLAAGPILRVNLWTVSPDEHALLITVHHIAFDGWSAGVLVRECAEAYKAFIRGHAPTLPAPLFDYVDFALWQRRWLEAGALERQLNYWKQTLANTPDLDLPTDRNRPAMRSSRGATVPITFDASLTAGIEALARQHGVTPFMVLLGGFALVLGRYARQNDIVVGSPIANRNRSEIENMIGFFVNTLALRVNLDGDPTVAELLGRVRRTTLDAYANQDAPFEKVVDALAVPRDTSRTPLFQVMLILQNAPFVPPNMEAVTVEPISVDAGAAKFDLTLNLTQTVDGLRGAVQYCTDLFNADTIDRLTQHLRRLLVSMVANSDKHLSKLDMLSPDERHQLLVEWNDTAREFPTHKCIHEFFAEQVERTPEAIAAVFEQEKLTYAELNTRANQLAHYLRTLGVGPEILVGVCVERSIEMLVSLLAILKAGGAYVPLDPVYPAERLAFMLADARAKVLLTQSHLQGKLQAYSAQVICIDVDMAQWGKQPSSSPKNGGSSANTAYVIYTSGSTGKPKGVQIPHDALTNLLFGFAEQIDVRENDVLLAVTSLSFDIAGLELWLPLIRGATVHIASQEAVMDGRALKNAIASATIMQATPTTWRMLIDAGWLGHDSFRALCGGEALPPVLAQELVRRASTVWNVYGPTETTIWSAAWKLDAVPSRIYLGRGIANTRLMVLDTSFSLLPAGVPGELYIAGIGLARGYLNRPDLIAERFIPDPFGPPGSRMYRTGDLARWNHDGNLEFLGRIDHQVKLRGFRIELGEIESVLATHGSVRACVVVAREEVSGDKRLVAYVVPNDGECSVNVLRQHLGSTLPDYMIPATFVVLESLPLTPNGKIDRKALPNPNKDTGSNPGGGFSGPRDIVEQRVLRIWEEILDLRPISVTDNFFSIGGHSLLAVRVSNRIQMEFGVDIPIAVFLQRATIADLAAILRLQINYVHSSPLVEIKPTGSKLPFFCVHPLGGTVFSYYDLARCLDSDRPFYGLQSVGLKENEEPLTTIPDMATRYIEAIREVQPQGPYLLGGWSMGGIVASEIARQLKEQGQDIALLVMIDSPIFSYRQKGPVDEIAELATLYMKQLARSSGKDITDFENKYKVAETEEQLTEMLQQAKADGIITSDVGIDQLRRYLKIFKTNKLALENYELQPNPDRLLVLRSATHPIERSAESSLDWNEYASVPIQFQDIPGDHQTVLAKENVEIWAEQLKRRLDQAHGVPATREQVTRKVSDTSIAQASEPRLVMARKLDMSRTDNGFSAIYQFKFLTDPTLDYHIVVEAKDLRIERGRRLDANVTFTMTPIEHEEFVQGSLFEIRRLFTTGKISLSGELPLAMRLLPLIKPETQAAVNAPRDAIDAGAIRTHIEKNSALHPNFAPIERVELPSKARFEKEFVEKSRPVIITGATKGWEVMNMSPEKIRPALGHCNVVVYVGNNEPLSSPEKHLGPRKVLPMLMNDYLDMIANLAEADKLELRGGPDPLYNPPYCGSNVAPDEVARLAKYPEYFPREDYVGTMTWLGPKETLTILHRDLVDNLFVQIFGRKHFTLISPDQSEFLYTWAETKVVDRCDAFPGHPDLDKFPLFSQAKPLEVVVEPGEMLFIPAGWFHQVRSLSLSFSINYFTKQESQRWYKQLAAL